MAVTRWKFDIGGSNDYEFTRNPDRGGGDTYWILEPRMNEFDIIGSNAPNIQIDGFRSRRTLRWTAITGTMLRTLRNFFQRKTVITNCRDHLYPTSTQFNCFIVSFIPAFHPTTGEFPGSGEDTYDLEMIIIRMG